MATRPTESETVETYLGRFLQKDELIFPRMIRQLRYRWKRAWEQFQQEHPLEDFRRQVGAERWTSIMPVRYADEHVRPFVIPAIRRVVADITQELTEYMDKHGDLDTGAVLGPEDEPVDEVDEEDDV